MLFLSWLSKLRRLHRRARACPSPGLGLNSKHPWPPGCGRFSFQRNDCGGQIICRVSVGQDRLILTRFTAHPQALPNYRY